MTGRSLDIPAVSLELCSAGLADPLHESLMQHCWRQVRLCPRQSRNAQESGLSEYRDVVPLMKTRPHRPIAPCSTHTYRSSPSRSNGGNIFVVSDSHKTLCGTECHLSFSPCSCQLGRVAGCRSRSRVPYLHCSPRLHPRLSCPGRVPGRCENNRLRNPSLCATEELGKSMEFVTAPRLYCLVELCFQGRSTDSRCPSCPSSELPSECLEPYACVRVFV